MLPMRAVALYTEIDEVSVIDHFPVLISGANYSVGPFGPIHPNRC